MSKYNDEVRRVFKTYRPPFPTFIVDMVEYDDYLALRVYRPNIEEFSEPQKVQLAQYLYELRDAICTIKVKGRKVKCHIEGVENAPPNKG